MTTAQSVASEAVPRAAVPERAASEPSLLTILLIFWGAFATALAAAAIFNPDMYVRPDPDALLRMVEVRDLLGGQGWFDMMQYRIDPPHGVLMHWSRLIDAPIAGLVLLGDLFGNGERFALIAWPLLLFLGLMGGVMLSATALGGRAAAVPALACRSPSPIRCSSTCPNNIDHHNAQYALLAMMLAAGAEARRAAAARRGARLRPCGHAGDRPGDAALRGGVRGVRGAHLGAEGAERAERGVVRRDVRRCAGGLYLLAGSPDAPLACDALSWSFALPAAVAGFGLAALASVVARPLGRRHPHHGSRRARRRGAGDRHADCAAMPVRALTASSRRS